jgi:methyl-accepting chemotaxis protein
LKRLIDLSIARKLMLAFSLFTLLCLMLPSFAAGCLWYVTATERARASETTRVLADAGALVESVSALSSMNYALVADTKVERLEFLKPRMAAKCAKIDAQIAALRPMLEGAALAELQRVDALLADVSAREKRILAQLAEGRRGDAAADVDQMHIATFGKMNQALHAIVDQLGGKLRVNEAAASWRSALIIRVILAEMLLGALAVGLVAFFLVRRLITRPLDEISSAIAALTAGQLDVDIPETERGDEIGLIGRALEVFKERLGERVALQAEAAVAKEQTEHALAALEQRFGAAMRDQQEVVTALAAALRSIAAGDLATRITINVAPDYGSLKSDFNGALSRLELAMASIADGATGIADSAKGMSRSTLDLSQRTDAQARSLEESAAALDAITSAVARTAEGANEARSLAGRARNGAQSSGTVVDETLGAMHRIETASREIVQIVRVLDEIAAQTNLLALNATVVAARAGESGRGFTVVANEVRALARRSLEAAREIQGLVDASAVQVRQGVSLVTAAGQALRDIGGDVLEVDTLISAIAGAAQEQSIALHQVNEAVAAMERATHDNASMVEHTTAAVQALSEQAQAQAEALAAFRFSARLTGAAVGALKEPVRLRA